MNPFLTHGAISWHELMTSDPSAAATFYGKVLGWTTETTPMPTGDYTVGQIDGRGVSGIMKKPDANMPDAWSFYITVDDVHASVARATELGATVFLPTMEVPSVGTFAGIQDPQGAMIMLITYSPDDTDNQNPEIDFTKGFGIHGQFSWFELRTPDAAGAIEFYTKLLGWTTQEDSTGMGPYHLIKVGDVGIGGIMQPPPGQMPPHWGGYITVDNVDKTIEEVKASGGQVMFDAMTIPLTGGMSGRFTMMMDPHGAASMVITYSED